jgi:hypothetical protein
MRNLLTAVFLMTCFSLAAQEAQETNVIVRTKAKDAKFIGTSMGGSMIMIKDAQTGELLARGLTKGGTGNTDAIMRTPKERYTSIHEGAAAFETTLTLNKPTLVNIEALSPVNHESRVFSTTQVWLLPGKHMDEQGIIMEIPGFVVDGLYPQTHQGLSISNNQTTELKANIVMMCGCTISEGGLWDSSGMEIEGMIYVNGEYWKTVNFNYGGTPNTFTYDLSLEKTGAHEVIITAFDPRTKNTGVDQLNFRVNN